jgi:hypothetical protein
VANISQGLRDLLERLALNPSLARDLVADPEGTLAAEGLTVTGTELSMLRALDVEDLEQTRAMPRGGMRRSSPERGIAKGTTGEEDTRRRLAAQLELVAPFMGDADFYMGERTRGIRPQSIYPTPFAVTQALICAQEEFRIAFLDNPDEAVLTWPDLPLTDEQRRMVLIPAVMRRLKQLARDV